MKIEFTTADDIALEFPPEPVKLHLPSWYKETPLKRFDDTDAISQQNGATPLTVRSCIPVRDYLTSGYVIRNDVDRVIQVMDDGGYVTHAQHNQMSFHPHDQCPVHIKEKKRHYFKFMNPWMIRTPKNYSCLFYQPEYFFEERYKLLPAIVDTDKHTNPVNFIGTAFESFVLKAGTPLMVVFPFKRDEWTASVEQKEFKLDKRFVIYLKGAYKKFFHSKKSYR